MSYYKRGKFTNKFRLAYTWDNVPAGRPTKFVETLIVRGIGYRTFALNNDFLGTSLLSKEFVETLRPVYTAENFNDSQEITFTCKFEFPSNRYLTVRAGHTRDMTMPLHKLVKCASRKKDRKLVVMSEDKILAANLARRVHLYREPSVYTGRGVRIKHIKPLRKAGKKDKQRGKAF